MTINELCRTAILLLLLLSPRVGRADPSSIEDLLQQGRTVEALEVVASRLARSPDDLGLQELHLDIRVGMGFGAGEVSRLEYRVQRSPEDADGWYLLGRGLLDPERSLAAYEVAIRLSPAHARAWMGRGSIQQHGGACDQAEESYAHALSLDPLLIEAWVGRVRCHVQSENREQAQKVAQLTVEAAPGEANGWLALAALDAEHELEHLQKGLKHRPGDREILRFLLEAAMAKRDLELALNASGQLAELNDSDVGTARGLLLEVQDDRLPWDVLHEVLGARGRGLGVARAAILVKEYPDSIWLQLVYARTLWASNELESAEILLRELLPLFEGGQAHRTLAMLLADSRRPVDAAHVLLPLTELHPDDMEAQVLLAMALVDAKEAGVARAQLEEVLSTHPLDRGLRYTHTYVLMLLGENHLAVEGCLAYLEHWPDEGVATWLTGAALHSGRQSEARETLAELQRMTGNASYGELASQL